MIKRIFTVVKAPEPPPEEYQEIPKPKLCLGVVALDGGGTGGARGAQDIDRKFLTVMGIEVLEGDEVEVTARVVSRIVTKRVRLDD